MVFEFFKEDWPVVVGLSGGLGNQMFQYAAGRALADRLGCSLVLDRTWFQGRRDRAFGLEAFKIEASTKVLWPRFPKMIQSQLSRISRRWASRLMGVPIFREPHFHYTPDFANLEHPVFLEGYWQSELYFTGCRERLLRDFTLHEPLAHASKQLLEDILVGDSICIHVRRGDYISDPASASIHGTCSVDYYSHGVGALSRGLARPRCFIFSDDPVWVRETLSFECPSTVVDINGPDAAHLDLVLMAACRHFLIANSSLSWWGAWLGTHPEKRVVAPAHWFVDENRNTQDLIPANWERL